MQRRDYSCGAAALATIARYYWGDDVGEELFLRQLDQLLTVEEQKDRVENGLTMADLRRAAIGAGYQASVGKVSMTKLMESKVPVVVGITVDDHDHFAVYRGIDGQRVYLADPIRGNVREPIPQFMQQWQKNTILVIAKPGAKLPDWSPLSLFVAEVELGELNDQLIRRVPTWHPNPTPHSFRR